MKRLLTAVDGAVAVAGCVAGLLQLGPDTSRPPVTAAPAHSARLSPVDAARKATKAYPEDPAAWAGLARAEIEQARTALDAVRLDAASRALRTPSRWTARTTTGP